MPSLELTNPINLPTLDTEAFLKIQCKDGVFLRQVLKG
jgi:hypothetical protein